MNTYLVEAITFFTIGLLVLVAGQMRLIKDTLHIPFLLSSLIFIGFYGVSLWHEFVIPWLGFSHQLNRVLFYDYGNGLLGLLPLSLTMLVIGKHCLKMSYKEQWSGTTKYKSPSLRYGLISGIILAAIPLILVATTCLSPLNGWTNLSKQVVRHCD